MEKKYQVFVSSTFEDLREERALIYDTLLRIDCFPIGMERFPAADEEQLKVIERLMDECDYYVLILAGRYGSTTAAGRSFTEAEYDAAVVKGIPVLAFVHAHPEKTEINDAKDPRKWEALLKFRERVMQRGKMNASYKDKADLAIKVVQSLTDSFKTKPRTGWVRGDRLVSDSVARELLELRQQLDYWKGLAADADQLGKFANGSDVVQLDISTCIDRNSNWNPGTVELTWDWIFNAICDDLFTGKTADSLATALSSQIDDLLKAQGKAQRSKYRLVDVGYEAFRKVIVQFKALGLIDRNFEGLWTLTNLGETKYYELRAIPKMQNENPAVAEPAGL